MHNRFLRWIPSVLLLVCALMAAPTAAQEIVESPKVVLGGVEFSLTVDVGAASGPIEVRDALGGLLAMSQATAGETVALHGLIVDTGAGLPVTVTVAGTELEYDPPYVWAWFSLAPPLLAILLALIFREVITALFAGIWLGCLFVAGYNPIGAIWRSIDGYGVPQLADADHASIVIFSLLLGGLVGIVARNGGTRGVVDAVTPFAHTQRRGKIATWAAGLAIFFDDYANTLVVGNTMRPITDRLKISREKLAYIVDSTAAPVATLVPVSTWVGYEMTLIGDGLEAAAAQPGLDPTLASALSQAGDAPFGIFLQTIPYLFYPLLAVSFVLLTSVMNRDFGPMAKAEARAASGGGLFRPGAQLPVDTSDHVMEPKPGTAPKWYNAGIPILTTVLVVVLGLYFSGRAGNPEAESLMQVLEAADSYATLLWGSLAGCLMGIAMSVGQGILTMKETLDAWVGGMRAMLIAMVILVMAWSLGAVTQDLGTADFLTAMLSESLAVELLPAIVFAISSAVAFATGTSWTTMVIMIPLVIPLTVSMGGAEGFADGSAPLLMGAIASVLAGAIFGDHCSPISDTTVLSSTASACDHVDHVRTQMPYALLVGVVAMLIGNLGTAYGLPVWAALVLGLIVLAVALRFMGREVDEPDHAPTEAEILPA